MISIKSRYFKYFMYYKYITKKYNITNMLLTLINYMFILNVLDAVTTYLAIKYLNATELNNIVNLHINLFGIEFTMFIKVIIISFLLYVLKKQIRLHKDNKYMFIYFCTWCIMALIYVITVISNTRLIILAL